jgi:pilus assembly protein CpaF
MADNGRQPVASDNRSTDPEVIQKLKSTIRREFLESMDLAEASRMPVEQLHEECSRRVDRLLGDGSLPLSGVEKQRLLNEIMDEIFGLGPIEQLLLDRTISDIVINGPHQIFIERHGLLESTDIKFTDEAHLLQVIQRIAARVGRRIDQSSPMLDARLLDGSRVNAIIRPLSLTGPAVSIRRFGTMPLSLDALIGKDTMAPEMAEFLKACVTCRLNILISGGTGSGKTTVLNVLSKWIPSGERVITLEDAAELQLQREHVVSLETRPPNIEGQGEVTQRDLLRNALRMRPDRIIIGEVRGAEALDMLQAMNTGHDGSMTTVHANRPRDALRRIENMVSMAGLNYPVHVIRDQVASALNVIIHLNRMIGGGRKVASVAEITGTEGDTIALQEIFRYVQEGVEEGRAVGYFESCGVRPNLLKRFEDQGISMDRDLFQRRKLETQPQSS